MRPFLFVVFLLVFSAWISAAQVPAGSGMGSLRYSADGRLGQLFQERHPADPDQYRLLYRERNIAGIWTAASIVMDYRGDDFFADAWSPYWDAWLFFDQDDEPLVFLMPNELDRSEILVMKKSDHGGWSLVSKGVLPDRLSTSENEFDWRSFQQMAAAQGRSGSYHFVVRYSDDLGPGSLLYARFNEGAWTWEFARRDIQNWLLNDVAAPDWGFGIYRLIPRNLGLAIDAAGKAHIVYSADPFFNPISGGTELRSDLLYLSNVSGSWRNEVLLSPGSGFGDAGASASIAVAPNGVIAVASIYIPRARTGSPGRASLRYFTKNMNGTWSQSTVSDSSDNYRGGDGERGTGMHPFLLFDEQSRPRIVFNDYASQHWPGFGAEAYSGQIRLAMRDNPLTGNWRISTLLNRGSVPATDHWVFWPAMASSRGETVVAAQSWRFFPSGGGSEPREEFQTHLFTRGGLPPTPRTPVGFLDDRSPVFTWSPGSHQAWYRLYVTDGTTKVIDTWIKSATSYQHNSLLKGGNYAWYVVGWDARGLGTWSSPAVFNVPVRMPQKVQLIAPVGQLSEAPTRFIWTEDSQATWYRLWIGESGGPALMSAWYPTQGGTQMIIEVPGLQRSKSYHWYVRPWGPDGFGPWSDEGLVTAGREQAL